MTIFSGTTQKGKACEKTVYWVEQLTADNVVYHKTCFRCHHFKGTLKACCTASPTLINCSSLLGAWRKASKVCRKLSTDRLIR
ncbi:hypothetical protein MLD38_021829 [Melastoma candidum]|uniref:Uncharacterized protein n=1 Tax=Melastoma candidum TaxID=119954 RepID=A0ACB9QKQ4_9MYRT|nr:hypothetical protein MLD38_021829 [Melastoma candidum]